MENIQQLWVSWSFLQNNNHQADRCFSQDFMKPRVAEYFPWKWRERVRDIRASGTTWWWWWSEIFGTLYIILHLVRHIPTKWFSDNQHYYNIIYIYIYIYICVCVCVCVCVSFGTVLFHNDLDKRTIFSCIVPCVNTRLFSPPAISFGTLMVHETMVPLFS